MIARRIVAVLVVSTALGACASDGTGDGQLTASILGAVGGALLGSQIGDGSTRVVTAAAGALLGSWLGSELGKKLDKGDREALNEAQQAAYNAPAGQPVAWTNDKTGNHGTITATGEATPGQGGAFCRSFDHKVTVDGASQNSQGVVCRQLDGTWKIVE